MVFPKEDKARGWQVPLSDPTQGEAAPCSVPVLSADPTQPGRCAEGVVWPLGPLAKCAAPWPPQAQRE